MSEYGKRVGFGELKAFESPKVEEIEALLAHIETEVKKATSNPAAVAELLRQMRDALPDTDRAAEDESLKERDLRVFKAARSFLFSESPDEITPDIIERYLSPEEETQGALSLELIYVKCLETAMNSNLNARVIASVLGGSPAPLKALLEDYNPRKTFEKFNGNPEKLLGEVLEIIEADDEINLTSKGPWPRYCKTVISAAGFLSQFTDGNDFISWAEHFTGDFRSVPALPLLLGKEIYGLGFALACDFLINLGLESYCTVDSTVKGMLVSSGLLEAGADGFQTLKALSRIAQHNGTLPYQVDKVFWLIGTGYFYNHLDLGKQSSGARLKKLFLEQVCGA